MVFSPPSPKCSSSGGGQPDAGPQSRPSENPLRLPKHEPKDDPVGRGKRAGRTMLSLGDYPTFGNQVSENRDDWLAGSSDWRSGVYGSMLTPYQSFLANLEVSDPPSRPRRSSWSYYDTRAESQGRSVAFANYEASSERLSQVLHPRRSWDGGRGTSSELKTDSLELVPWHGNSLGTSTRQADSFQVVGTHRDTSNIGSPPRRGPLPDVAFDSTQTEPAPNGLKQSSLSELSRESLTELELLKGKLKLRIILAEDNKINQKVASRQLEKHGHVVNIVDNGQRALETICAQHDDFDLILMDVQVCP